MDDPTEYFPTNDLITVSCSHYDGLLHDRVTLWSKVESQAEEITRLRAEIEERKKDRYEQTVNLREANDRELALEEEITRLREKAAQDDKDAEREIRHQQARAEAAEARLAEAVEVLREAQETVSACCTRPGTCLTSRVSAFLAKMEKPRD